MQSGKLSRLLLIVWAPPLLVLASCSDKKGDNFAAAAASPPSSRTTSPASAETPIKSSVTVSGPLIVEHQLDVLAQREGIVVKLLSDAGARVRSGDLLAQLDDRQFGADLEASRAKTRSTEAELKTWQAEAKVLQSDYERAEKLWAAQVITREQLEHAKFKAEADQWDVKRVEQLLINAKETEHSLELEVDKSQIRAPFSGIVARRYVREGQQVAKGDRLFWVTAEGPLRMRFTLPERYIGQVKKGQELWLTTADIPGQEYKARVMDLSSVVDPSSSTFDVLVQLAGPAGALRPGMDASVRIENLR